MPPPSPQSTPSLSKPLKETQKTLTPSSLFILGNKRNIKDFWGVQYDLLFDIDNTERQ